MQQGAITGHFPFSLPLLMRPDNSALVSHLTNLPHQSRTRSDESRISPAPLTRAMLP